MSYNLAERFAHLSTLRPNWDSYGARPPAFEAMSAARRYVESLSGPADYAPTVCPMVTGGLQVVWYTSGFDIEIDFDPAGKPVAHVYEHAIKDDTALDDDLALASPKLVAALARFGVKAAA